MDGIRIVCESLLAAPALGVGMDVVPVKKSHDFISFLSENIHRIDGAGCAAGVEQ